MNRFFASLFMIFFCAFCAVFFQNCAEDLRSNADSYKAISASTSPRDPVGPIIQTNELEVTLSDAIATQGKLLKFEVFLSQPAPSDITVAVQSIDGSAVGSRDYSVYNDSIQIPKGSRSKSFSIPTQVTASSNYKQMAVRIVSLSQGVIQKGNALGTIAPLGAPEYGESLSSLNVGSTHICAIGGGTTGVGKCWGTGTSGALGHDKLTNSKVPVAVKGLGNGVQSIVTGTSHSCALTSNNLVRCWGDNSQNQLGNASAGAVSKISVAVGGLKDVQQISAGTYSTCARLLDGTVKCWGQNSKGELGNNSIVASKTPVMVYNLSEVKSVSVGGSFACALLANGTVKCWGLNSSGQLGRVSSLNRYSSVPLEVPNIANATAIAAGVVHACALLKDGSVKCWGASTGTYLGQLGHSGASGSTAPVAVKGLTKAKALSVGRRSSCAIAADDTIKCWGQPYTSAKGVYGSSIFFAPINIMETAGAVELAVGVDDTCFKTKKGEVKCWGVGRSGSHSRQGKPVTIGGL